MISALGTRVVVTGAAAEIHPEELEAALRGSSEPTVINLDDITNTEVRSGDSWDESTVAIESGGETVTVRFAPGDTEGPQQLCALLTGESVNVDTITGFSFVAVAVHTASQDWGSVDRVDLARVTDGEVTERFSLEPPTKEALADFIGDSPSSATTDTSTHLPCTMQALFPISPSRVCSRRLAQLNLTCPTTSWTPSPTSSEWTPTRHR